MSVAVAPATAARRATNAVGDAMRRAWAGQAFALATLAALGAGAFTPLAGLVRWTFPAGVALAALYLESRKRSGAYVSLCLWAFVLTPFLRRVVDAHVGYSQANVMMLTPYLATGLAVLRLPGYFLRRTAPLQAPVAVALLCIGYGFAMALAAGRLLPGAIDALRWITPPLLAVYVMSDPARWSEICAAVKATTTFALPLVGLYGLWQFVSPPAWDGYWMLNSGMSSIGVPRPFEIRVFATLNSPGSLAFWLVALLLISATLRSPFRWPNLLVGVAVLAVTLIRTAWLGLALGVAILAARARPGVRVAIVAATALTMTLAPLALTNPRVEELVTKRVGTLLNLGGDQSYALRAAAYSEFRSEIAETPWGEGFGVANVAGSYGESSRMVDGGPIEILLALGVGFGGLYLGAIAAVLATVVLRPPPAREADLFMAAGAIAVVEVVALSSATTVVGEIGVVFWLAAALVVAAPRKHLETASPTATGTYRIPAHFSPHKRDTIPDVRQTVSPHN
jgi:hypothetical protein